MARCLGKLAPRVDSRSPALDRLALSNPLPPAPAVIEVPASDYPMLGNDQVGNCTVVGTMHTSQAWYASRGILKRPTAAAAISGYSKVSGYVPGHQVTDRGAYLLNVMQYWYRRGFALNDIDAVDQIQGYATVRHQDIELVRRAINAFGAVEGGLALPASAEFQEVWDVTDLSLAGEAAPGSWGGHAAPLLGCNEIGPKCPTWGGIKQMTWAFWETYADEAYVALSTDWLAGDRSPRGLSWRSLVYDIRALCATIRNDG